MSIASEITRINTNIANAYTECDNKGATMPQIQNSANLANTIASITGGGGEVSTQSQSIFTGYTAPLTWLNSTNNVFTYESATHNITITGLSGIATITGNGTKSVTVTINTTASSNRQTAFTISCANNGQTVTYKGIAFHYGSDLGSGNCLAVAQTLVNNQIGYVFIESASLPLFSSNTASWNSIYSHQLISFDFGKFSATSIGDNFLSNCYSFNQPLTIPSSVTNIGDNFLSNCSSFNQPLTISNSVTSINNLFLSNCYSFNQPLTIPSSVTSIGVNFLYYCYSFNQPLTISSSVTSIEAFFLNQCYSFNQPLSIPSGVTSIGSSFLNQCYSFNQPLTIPNSVIYITNNFLRNCYSFNQPLTIPSSVTSIGDNFLSNCYSFNQPLNISNVVIIGNNFLSICYSFNQPLTIPSSVTRIGTFFLRTCYSFNQPLTVPSGVTNIGTGFLYDCFSFIYLEYNASVYPTDKNSLSQSINTKTSSTGTGIFITGTGASSLKSALPNITTSPYRKLV